MKHMCLQLFFLLSVVLLCTACSSMSAPSSGASSSPTVPAGFQTTLPTTDQLFTVHLTITPNRVGSNVFTVRVFDKQNVPATAMQVTLQTTMLDMDTGTQALNLLPDSHGSFSSSGNLDMSGHWQIRLVLHTLDHVLHETQVQVMPSA